jgi:hypothetical protein
MGFEPMIRVLQTLALPLGHVAGSEWVSGRWDSNPRPSPWQGDVLPTEPRPLVNYLGFLPGEPHSSRKKKPRQPYRVNSPLIEQQLNGSGRLVPDHQQGHKSPGTPLALREQ